MTLTTPLRRATIFCRDAERSLPFYRDLLGFAVVEDKQIGGPAVGRMIGFPEGCRLRVIHLQAEDGPYGWIGLYQLLDPVAGEVAPPDPTRIRFGQTALVMETAHGPEILARLQAAGTPFLSPPTEYVKREPSGVMPVGIYTEMLFFDPDGVLISLIGFRGLDG